MKERLTLYPIIVPIKKKSVRLPNKNKHLIKYTLQYLEQYGKENVFILTDDEEINEKYKNDYQIIEDKGNNNDLLDAINNCAKKINSEYVFCLCVTNPFRENGLLFKMMDKCYEYNNELPFITTKTIVPNRKIFLIDENDKFIYKSPKGRKGKYVKSNYMIDGAAYLFKTSFLNDICISKTPNKTLWESNFKTVLNNVPFIDIDTQKDMNDFLFYINIKEG